MRTESIKQAYCIITQLCQVFYEEVVKYTRQNHNRDLGPPGLVYPALYGTKLAHYVQSIHCTGIPYKEPGSNSLRKCVRRELCSGH